MWVGQLAMPLADGEVVMGRSTSCDITIDDALASRRHAALTVKGRQVFIRDLESRNGVLVDGVRIFGPVAVGPGSDIVVGRTPVKLVHDSAGESDSGASQEPPQARSRRAISSVTKKGDVFAMLVRSCVEALDSGRIGDAEFATSNLLASVSNGLERGFVVDEAVFTVAAEFAIRLAERTGDEDWVERVLEVHARAEKVLDGDAVVRLQTGVVHPTHASVFAYIMKLQARSSAFTAEERERLDRLATLLEDEE